MENQLGKRLKFFRKRSSMLQGDLEKAIGAAAGSISRIESGKTNPTKETIDKISKVLNLNHHEISYLNGAFSTEISEEDILNAIDEVSHVLENESTISYLLDENRCIRAISKGLQKISGVESEDLNLILGENIFELISNQSHPGHKLFSTKDLDEMLITQLNRLLYEIPYIFSEPYWLNLFKKLRKNKLFKHAWDKVSSPKNNIDIFTVESRTIKFTFRDVDISLVYAEEALRQNSRFKLVTYFSNNNLINFLLKL